MADKPGDFLIGVIDFFAILLPGAVAAFFGMGAGMAYVSARPHIFGALPADLWADARGWVVFAVASYLLGQFIFLLGGALDGVYDLVRKYSRADRAISGELKNKGLAKWLRQGWVDSERLFKQATTIKKEEDAAAGVVNTFQWARAIVQIRCPAAAAEIYRLEADQKFFRGLIVVLFLICILFVPVYGVERAELIPYILLMILSFVKYVYLRRKGQNLAYTYLIALKARQSVTPEASAEQGHAAAD